MENNSIKLIRSSFSSVFNFKLCHYKALDDYITLHNLSILLTYIGTLYHNIIIQ